MFFSKIFAFAFLFAAQSYAVASDVRVETDLYRATVDERSGDIVFLELKNHKASPDGDQFRVFDKSSGAGWASISSAENSYLNSAFVGARKNISSSSGGDPEVTISASLSDGTSISKSYRFRNGSYAIEAAYSIIGNDRTDALGARFDVNHRSGSGNDRVVYLHNDAFMKVTGSSLRKSPVSSDTNGGWIATDDRFFLSGWVTDRQSKLTASTQDSGAQLVGISIPFAPPNGSGVHVVTAKLYAGPKDAGYLEAAHPTLVKAEDYGWLSFIAIPTLRVLKWLHSMLGNWGLSILALTVMIKMAFHPMSMSGYRSMAKMRKMAPVANALRDKHKGDDAALQREMMSLYKAEGTNPVAGCLPILIQFPVFIALFWVLKDSIELRHSQFLWIKDLSAPDSLFVLPLATAAFMFMQNHFSPKPAEKAQARMLALMPVIVSGIFFILPAGLVLYAMLNTAISALQQWIVRRDASDSRSSHACEAG